MKHTVYIDGQEGTTGLQLRQRLAGREELEIIEIDPLKRKDPSARAACLNAAEVAFLCLPDAAAREAVGLVENDHTVVIDSSTAHRTDPEWDYGFPELSARMRDNLRRSKRIAVPGCHATGFLSIIRPLTAENVIARDYPVCCHSVSGYSGGGKKMIAEYETGRTPGDELCSLRYYALGLRHKHLPEMQHVGLLASAPLFTPSVGDFKCGMLVTVPLYSRLLRRKTSAAGLHRFYEEFYRDEPFVRVMPFDGEGVLPDGRLGATACNGTNRLELFVFGNEEQILVAARLDNLGKGASGAAVQCMNLALGLEETAGL